MKLSRRVVAPVVLALAGAFTLTACVGDTESAENVTATSASLQAWGVPESSQTDFYFEWGPSAGFGNKTAEQHPNGLEAGRLYPISAQLDGLTPNTRYYFRICGKERSEAEFECGNTRSFITTMFSNPTVTADGKPTWNPDAKVVHVGGAFYSSAFFCLFGKSANGIVWSWISPVCGDEPGRHPAQMVINPPDHNVKYWGTEVTKVGATWVAVTSGNRQYDGYTDGALWVATAPSPDGPWTWRDDPLLDDPKATLIDPSIFVDPLPGGGGKIWLTWTHYIHRPAPTLHNQLMAVELDPADITHVRQGAQRYKLLDTAVQPQKREEAYGRHIVEGQGVFSYAGRYFLHYAAGNVGCKGREPYTFNIAENRETFPGMFTKRAEPTLRGSTNWIDPGHGSVFTDAGGNLWSATSPHFSICDTQVYKVKPIFLQKMTFNHVTRTFSIYDGVMNAGPIGAPIP